LKVSSSKSIQKYDKVIILGVVKTNPLFFHSISCKNNGFLFTTPNMLRHRITFYIYPGFTQISISKFISLYSSFKIIRSDLLQLLLWVLPIESWHFSYCIRTHDRDVKATIYPFISIGLNITRQINEVLCHMWYKYGAIAIVPRSVTKSVTRLYRVRAHAWRNIFIMSQGYSPSLIGVLRHLAIY